MAFYSPWFCIVSLKQCIEPCTTVSDKSSLALYRLYFHDHANLCFRQNLNGYSRINFAASTFYNKVSCTYGNIRSISMLPRLANYTNDHDVIYSTKLNPVQVYLTTTRLIIFEEQGMITRLSFRFALFLFQENCSIITFSIYVSESSAVFKLICLDTLQ